MLKYYIVTAILFFIEIRKAQPSLCKGGDTMSMLEDIKNAEQKADDLKKQATLEARNTVRDAQAEAHKILTEKSQKMHSLQAEAQAKQEADALVEKNRKRDEAQAAEARKNLDGAVQYIMKKVVIEC